MNKRLSKSLFRLIQLFLIIFLTGCGSLTPAEPTLIPTLTPVQISVSVGNPGSLPAALYTPEPTPTSSPNDPIWVANPVDQTVLRVDPNRNEVTNSIFVGGQPDQATPYGSSVWVLDRKSRQVYRIDPNQNQVVNRIQLPEGHPETMVVGSGSIWVGVTGKVDLTAQMPGEEPAVAPAEVVRIDPQTNKVAGQYSVQPVQQLAVSGSLIWVLSRGNIDTPVQVLDIANNLGMSVPFKNAPNWLVAEAMAVDGQSLWLFSSAYSKIFRSTLDGHVISAIPIEEQQPVGYADLILADSGLWAATPWGSLMHFDPASNHLLGKVDLGAPLTQLIAGHAAMWALSQQTGTLFRVDPANHQVVAHIQTGKSVQPTVIPTPTPRVVVWQPCPDAPTSRLKVGDLAYVTKDPPLPNRVRKEAKKDGEILGYINPGGSMKLLEGPTCAEGWVWWKVKNADLEGWTAEGDKETYWLVPLFK